VSERRRVFVRGVGAVTPLGASWPDSFAALAEGRSAVRPIQSFDASGFPCTVAAALPREVEERLPPAPGADRRALLALPAAREAWLQARAQAEPERIGVFVGAESGRASLATLLQLARAAGGGQSFDHKRFGREAASLAGQLAPLQLSSASVASLLAAEVGARGPVATVALACASGAAAIAEAARAVRRGECDVALCGGVGADVDPLLLAGFGLLGALSQAGVSRPFDAHRDGFVLGEGAAFAVLSAERGRAQVELAGFGRSLDAHHITAPDPHGDGARRAIAAALADAGLAPREVGAVQAHGTSTPLNDLIEAAALRDALGPALDDAAVSSVKGALGHCIAAAGALGLLCGVEAVARGEVLPTAHLREPDPQVALVHVLGRSQRRTVRAALVDSFAFGGANVVLALRAA
jgi:3-oxoacyl-[acyl-carrier-protein] synthase II